MTFGLSEQQLQAIKDVLAHFPAVSRAKIFGSRAMGTHKAASDVDISIQGEGVNHFVAASIKAYFEDETYLPFFFDVIAYDCLDSEKMKTQIDKHGKLFYRKGWVEKNLVSCLEKVIDYRGKTPKKSDSGILTLSAKSVKMGAIDYSKAYYISKETYDKFMVRGFPKKGDILMTTEAPLGCIAKLDRDNVSVAQRLLTLRGKEGVLDNDYLMFYLTSRRGQHELQARASGSTVQGIKRSEFEHVQIVLPPLPEQKAIADMLSSFDEKIELLREQNKTLETLAQTIFKEWFVNFNYPDATREMVESELGLIPKGWRVGKVSDLGKIVCGKTPSKSKKEFFGGDVPFIKIPDMHNNMFIVETTDSLTQEGKTSQPLKTIPNGSISVSCIATVGLISISIKEGYVAKYC